MRRIQLPLDAALIEELRCGEAVLLSGPLLTARDAAHARLVAALENGEPLPVTLDGAVLYYVGPTPAKPGEVLGSAGPTTSARMDGYTPRLLEQGLKGMIGKGDRAPTVVDAMVKNKAVYFAATGGAGALLSSCVTAAKVVAYPELGTEAICRLTVRDFPAVVAIDCRGEDLYKTGPARYRAQRDKR